jgi:hypothetical protein
MKDCNASLNLGNTLHKCIDKEAKHTYSTTGVQLAGGLYRTLMPMGENSRLLSCLGDDGSCDSDSVSRHGEGNTDSGDRPSGSSTSVIDELVLAVALRFNPKLRTLSPKVHERDLPVKPPSLVMLGHGTEQATYQSVASRQPIFQDPGIWKLCNTYAPLLSSSK